MAVTLAPNDAGHRSLGELIGDISDGSAQLVRDEIRLARAEGVESLLSLRRGATVLGAALVLGFFAGGAAIACVVLVLSQYVLDGRTWLAALVVALVLGVAAWIATQRGLSALSAKKLAPSETAKSLKETATWLKHPTKSAVR